MFGKEVFKFDRYLFNDYLWCLGLIYMDWFILGLFGFVNYIFDICLFFTNE